MLALKWGLALLRRDGTSDMGSLQDLSLGVGFSVHNLSAAIV